jgi:hypothetical protein
VLTLAGVALAVVPTGLQNGSFEQDLTGWNATTVRQGSYGSAYMPPQPAVCRVPDGVCVIDGSDTFTVREMTYYGGPGGPSRTETVTPLDGNKMLRLGGPFETNGQQQPLERYRVSQTFKVDPANPVLQLNYNVYTYDYLGFDNLFFRVRLTDENGHTIAREEHGSFGSGTSLKSTGWQPAQIDLTGYENQDVHLLIDSGGTQDQLYGFWAYIDAGFVPPPPVGEPGHGQVQAPSGQPVPIQELGGNGNQKWFAIPTGLAGDGVADFPPANGYAHCMPLPITVPINPGAGTVSNAQLILDQSVGGTKTYPMSHGSGNNWNGTVTCVSSGDLFVTYTVTEGSETHTFTVPIGGIVLIDPQGVVYDKQAYDSARASGQSEEQARASSAITGATVRLQRCTTQNPDSCANVLSGDPGIAPNINPETTAADGRYQWDVSHGFYRVVVTKAAYATATSPIWEIPPPKLDGHIAMTRTGSGGGTQTGGQQTGGQQTGGQTGAGDDTAGPGLGAVVGVAANENAAAPNPKPCAGLKGQKLRDCQAKETLKKALAKCGTVKAAKKAVCAKKARAMYKCNRLTGKKATACRKKAAKIRK